MSGNRTIVGVLILGGFAVAIVSLSREKPPQPTTASTVSEVETSEEKPGPVLDVLLEQPPTAALLPPPPAAGPEVQREHVSPIRPEEFPFDVGLAPFFEAKYANSTVSQLEAARTSIERAITDTATPILLKEFEAGRGTFLEPYSRTYRTRPEDQIEICAVQMRPDDGVYRAVLSRDEYPDLHALRDESLWLRYAIEARFVQARSRR